MSTFSINSIGYDLSIAKETEKYDLEDLIDNFYTKDETMQDRKNDDETAAVGIISNILK